MEIVEVVRRWQLGESQRAIARASGVARQTVSKYLRAAEELGVAADGPPPSEDQLVKLVQVGSVVSAGRVWPSPQADRLEPYREQLTTWLRDEHLQLTRIQELLGQRGLHVPYTTLERFVWRLGFKPRGRRGDTVRMAPTPPGEVAEMDFERLGLLLNRETSRRQWIWGLSVTLTYSRHSFLWPLIHQTVEATIEGLEQAWAFFQGCPKRLVLDNFPAAVAGKDPLNPRPTRAFIEYSQARGFLVDPARVRHPRDKPQIERFVQYARGRFWKGGTFLDLADARRQARPWCLDVAGQRVHGTTRKLPLVVFEDEERAHLLPYDGIPYDVPLWKDVTVHADHHVSVQYALYSAPSTTCPPGTKLEARCDQQLVRLYRHGELVKVHARQPKGGRSTDPDDYPPERTAYAMRAPDRLVRQAVGLGPHIGQFAERLVDAPFPWSKLRQGQKLLRLAERYTPERLDTACARALGFDLVDVRRLERILVLALEHEGEPPPPPDQRVRPLPAARFVRPGSAFDHRFAVSSPEVQP
ncbi:MAG TPA: IS21 family transposase [Chloroflexota bacterium]|nr:IS21 family transposase [Chloroflexota bacterium]